MPNPLCASVREKVEEQIERTAHLLALLPPDSIDRAPVTGAWPVGALAGPLLECLAGFCAVLMAATPDRLAQFGELRALRVNHACGAGEALARLDRYRAAIREGFDAISDADLARRIPTVFVPAGETLLTLLLGNFEHLVNHKHQLFTCLKLLGVPVGSSDLYRFRG